MKRPILPFMMLSLVAVILLAGCTSTGYLPVGEYKHSGSDDTQRCLESWVEFSRQVNKADAFDAQDWPLPDYPYLRLTRASSYISQQPMSQRQQSYWLAQAYQRGKHARRIENEKLANPVNLSAVESCLSSLLSDLAGDPEFWELVRASRYPDSYLTGRQILGLYYLFRPMVAWQVEKLNAEVSSIFQHYKNRHEWRYYRLEPSPPPQWQEIKAILDADAHQDALGVPRFSEQDAEKLLRYYRPVIALEAGHRDDRMGRPQWQAGRWTTTSNPEVFTLLTHTLWQGQWVPQLVYHWWHPGRPKVGWLDILAGDLGGLVWRVTLGWNGKVLFYDSIHPCGCYHKVYPVDPSIEFLGTSPSEERLMVLPVEHPGPGYQPVVQVSSIAHYVVGLGFEKESVADDTKEVRHQNASRYEFYNYDELRSLRADDRYLFGPDGLVAGTERLERFLLWNMGVDSPGAMRQWGNHATAFASRRHFDDPLLFERYFKSEQAE